MKICIDAGHNDSGFDTGASGNGLREQDITYSVAVLLAQRLEKYGAEVMLTRKEKTHRLGYDLNSSLQERCDISNRWGADCFISIHCNSFYLPTPKGTEVYIIGRGGKAEKLASRVQKRLVEAVGTKDRGVKVQNLKVLRDTDAPAILVELAYICTPSDAKILAEKQEEMASAIADAVAEQFGIEKKEEVPMTVQRLDGVYIQEIYPPDFKIKAVDRPKLEIDEESFFNLGFFANTDDGKTIAVGNLADGGEILANSKDNASWLNVAGKKLSTIVVKENWEMSLVKTDDLTGIDGLKTAVSGIPIVEDGRVVSMDEIKAEGYFGNELYRTRHGFLGIRGRDLVYASFEADYGQMAWILIALGIRTAIKLDGGGSFILKNGRVLEATDGNRRINSIGCW